MKDPAISSIMRMISEGCFSNKIHVSEGSVNFSEELKCFQKIFDSLSVSNGCLFYGARLVVPVRLRKAVLQILHLGHFGMDRMKTLARGVVYWPGHDKDIVEMCQTCQTCAQHQAIPEKPLTHPWAVPEKPWMRLHIDHAINFLGQNWLILTDAHSKYPCIHATSSTTSKATIDLLEQDFAHFGYPYCLVSDNATTFCSEEFKTWCKDRGILHLTGAPYHPATNGAAERLVQSFKNSMRKSSESPKRALQEFLIMYRRTPNSSGFSPSQLLNGRQLRSKIDTLVPSSSHILKEKQSEEIERERKRKGLNKVNYQYSVDKPCYARLYRPVHEKEARWVPATILKVLGKRHFKVKVHPTGPVWTRHLRQLRPRFGAEEDSDPGYGASFPARNRDQPLSSAVPNKTPPSTLRGRSGPPRPRVRRQIPQDGNVRR